MKRAELLLPAGNTEKLEYAVAYGADAVYLGTADFSLRSPKSGSIITNDNIINSIDLAHKMGASAYVTLNVFANNEIMEKLPPLMELLADAKPDGIIFADPAFYSSVKKYMPDVPMHISTQANVLNYESVKFWQDLGATRIILARELNIKEIEQIAAKVPDIELEVLVHGSICVAYSGRCLLSDYMTNNERKSNQGNCTQPCRWKYKLIESNRPDDEFEISEDGHGTYIMNPKDIALIEQIPDLINAGVCSFKIEGRTKSMYYAAVVAKTYRKAIDAYYNKTGINNDELYEELSQAGNRGFTTGFLIDNPNSTHYDYKGKKAAIKSVFQGIVKEKISEDTFKIKTKNQIKTGEKIDLITPSSEFSTLVTEIKDEYDKIIQVANTNSEVYIKLKIEENSDYKFPDDWKWGILRQKAEIKDSNGIQTETHIYS